MSTATTKLGRRPRTKPEVVRERVPLDVTRRRGSQAFMGASEIHVFLLEAATNVQPLTNVPWPDNEMADGFSRVAPRRKALVVAWGEPSVSWRKQIKVETTDGVVTLTGVTKNAPASPSWRQIPNWN